MSFNNLLAQEIQQGESKTLEFKRELPKGQQIAKTLVAFANSKEAGTYIRLGASNCQAGPEYVQQLELQRIKQMCADEGLKEPEFLETGDFFDVKLYRPEPQQTLYSTGGAIGGSIGGAIESLTEAQLSVLKVIKENPSLSYRKMVEKLGINPSAVQKHLEKLKGLGVIERIGGTRGYWQVKL